ncbi:MULTISPECIES: hypothetical protein [Campylobacter]|uniref:hypothetical protein n=1 Tax=Campylobacter TaxID=194 RepID=UPI001E65DBCC|nr:MULTISPECIES: hypothetical protein [Campylobacter]
MTKTIRKLDIHDFMQRNLRKIVFIILLSFAVIMAGCANKPEIITRTLYQDVYIPMKCDVKLPEKPEYDKNDPDSAKKLAIYYKQVEKLLKGCIR